MYLFLTSDPCLTVEGRLGLNPANGFVHRLKELLPPRVRCLYICSDPDHFEETDFWGNGMRACCEGGGLTFSEYRILDRRNDADVFPLIHGSDLIILAGGHVPTQNRYFEQIGLGALLKEYRGVVVGISAGSMNCAEVVYAHPEEPGEAVDPHYQRFLPGLGLTEHRILPHFSKWREQTLDGLRLLEQIAVPDSCGNPFLILEDGSYALIHQGQTQIFGLAWHLEDGILQYIDEV